MPATPESDSPESMTLLLPLHFFYAKEERPVPEVTWLPGDEMPEPERSLLVHERDMTSRLAKFHECPIDLEVIAREQTDDYIMRMVVLRRSDDGRPVEFGAIGIDVGKFEGEIKRKIVNGEAPLGALLEKYVIDYRSSPNGYFSMAVDRRIGMLLDQPEGIALYGRSNQLTDADGMVFADIVEVLPRWETC